MDKTDSPAQPAAATAPQPAPRIQNLHIIVNPAAGQSQPVLNDLNAIFRPAGVTWEVKITQAAGDGKRLAQEALAAGVDAVGVYGGDGTVMEVATGLMRSDTPLAIFPGGSANVMSAELEIPANLQQAAALLIDGSAVVRRIDMGVVGEEYAFLTRVGTGLEAEVIQNTDREAKNRMGWMAYIFTIMRTLTNLPIARYRLTLDGRQVEQEGLMCVIANTGLITPNVGTPGRGIWLAPSISLSDGLLDVMVIQGNNLATLASAAASVVSGGEAAEPLLHWQAREVTLEADPPQPVQCDGEIIGPTPITARVLPQVINVIVPRERAAPPAA